MRLVRAHLESAGGQRSSPVPGVPAQGAARGSAGADRRARDGGGGSAGRAQVEAAVKRTRRLLREAVCRLFRQHRMGPVERSSYPFELCWRVTLSARCVRCQQAHYVAVELQPVSGVTADDHARNLAATEQAMAEALALAFRPWRLVWKMACWRACMRLRLPWA